MALRKVTYRYLVSASISALKQAFADKEFGVNETMWWVRIISNKILGAKFKTQVKNNQRPDSSYYKLFTDIPVLTGGNAPNTLKGRKYLDLPEGVFDLENERGIDWLKYYVNIKDCNEPQPQFFEPSTMTEIETMGPDDFERPRWDRPYMVRTQNRLYLFGVETIGIKTVDGFFLCTENPNLDITDVYDKEMNLSDQDINDIIQRVLQMGRWIMTVQTERTEGGVDSRNAQNAQQSNLPQEQQA